MKNIILLGCSLLFNLSVFSRQQQVALPPMSLCQDSVVKEAELLYLLKTAADMGTKTIDSYLQDHSNFQLSGPIVFRDRDSNWVVCTFHDQDGFIAFTTLIYDLQLTLITREDKVRPLTQREREIFRLQNLIGQQLHVSADSRIKKNKQLHLNVIVLNEDMNKRGYAFFTSRLKNQLVFGSDFYISFLPTEKDSTRSQIKRLHKSNFCLDLENEVIKKSEELLHIHKSGDGDRFSATDILAIMLSERNGDKKRFYLKGESGSYYIWDPQTACILPVLASSWPVTASNWQELD